MRRMLSLWFVFVAASSSPAFAEGPADKETCKPQPSCRLDYLDIKPGASGPGLKPQGDSPEKPGIIVNGISKGDARDSYRLPGNDIMAPR